MFKKIREMARKGPLPASRGIRSSNGHILWEPEDIAKRWEEYIASLFHDDREEADDKTTSYESGHSILKEVRWALQHCKPGKAAGLGEVVVEMLISLQEDGVDVLWSLFENIYETGQIPSEMLKSVFIAILKKSNTLDCENHRTISLMARTLKLFLKIILRRIIRIILPQIPTHQYGFMPERGTRNAIFVLRMLCERSIEHQQEVFLCFIDYQKAFDKVRHSQLLTILKRIGIDGKDFRNIRNLCYEQKAAFKLTEGLTEWTDIKRGVRQGCVMSPDLFNLYSEFILNELEVEKGIQVNGRLTDNIRYADDTVLLASSEAGLQMLVNIVQTSSEKFGLKLNINKTKVMVMSKQSPNEPLLQSGLTATQVR